MTLCKGDTGDAVGRLQQALLEAGRSIDAEELKGLVYGSSTAAAVADFQHHSTGPNGPLEVDGVAGSATMWALDHPNGGWCAPEWKYDPTAGGSDTRVSAVCCAAYYDLGSHEEPNGSNDGPQLAKFRTCGHPWCALAVSTWWATGGPCPWGRVAGTASLADWARAHGREVHVGAPIRPGDIFVIQRGDGHGHTGLIVGLLPDGRLCTIEGNCGNAVRGCVRRREDVTLVFRPLGEV